VHFSPAGADVAAAWLVHQVPTLNAAKRTQRPLADDLFDRLHDGLVLCTWVSAGAPTAQPFVSVAKCAVLASRNAPLRVGVLRVDRRPKQLLAYARNYRATSCATAPHHQRFAYVLSTYWIFTGTAAPEAAKALKAPLTYYTC
jgi:hypothetical protein